MARGGAVATAAGEGCGAGQPRLRRWPRGRGPRHLGQGRRHRARRRTLAPWRRARHRRSEGLCRRLRARPAPALRRGSAQAVRRRLSLGRAQARERALPAPHARPHRALALRSVPVDDRGRAARDLCLSRRHPACESDRSAAAPARDPRPRAPRHAPRRHPGWSPGVQCGSTRALAPPQRRPGLLRRRSLHRLALPRRARSEFFSTLPSRRRRPIPHRTTSPAARRRLARPRSGRAPVRWAGTNR